MNALANPHLYFEVKCFQAQEIALLQSAEYDQWLAMMTSDVVYRMPVISVSEDRAKTESGAGELAHYDDTLETLRLRVARMRSRMAWTEIPPSRVRYFVEPYAIEDGPEGVRVSSNLMVYQSRLQREENYYVGCRHDRLRRDGDGFLLAERVAVIDKVVLPGKNLTVFF